MRLEAISDVCVVLFVLIAMVYSCIFLAGGRGYKMSCAGEGIRNRKKMVVR